MRIIISLLNCRPGHIGGAETYLANLLEHMHEARQEQDRIFLLGHRGNARMLESAALESVMLPRGDLRVVLARCMEAFTPLHARSVEKALARLQPDVVLFPQQSMFPKRVGCPSVVIVYDVQHLFYPRYFSLFDRAFRAQIYPYSLQRADRVIAISEWTRKTVIQRCGVAPDKIVAVQSGIQPPRQPPPEPYRGLDSPYLYYPAATFPHKGHAALFRTYAALRRRGNFPYRLLLTGKQTSYWRTLRREIRSLGIAGDVTHLGFVSRQEVASMYAGAAAVVFPTEFEGLGLPAVEAAQFGRKIICSTLEVFDEIGVPRRFQIDFREPKQLLAALALPGATILEKTLPPWSEVAREILCVLRAAAEGGGVNGGGQSVGLQNLAAR